MSDERTPPIEPLNYIGGVKVVDIGDLRVARGMSRRPVSVCRHTSLVYDQKERRVWCKECETDVEAFDAFTGLVERYSAALDDMTRRAERVAEAEKFAVRSLAAKEMDKAWRSREYVPGCPHCHRGLFPEDFKNGVSMLSRDYATALNKRGKP